MVSDVLSGPGSFATLQTLPVLASVPDQAVHSLGWKTETTKFCQETKKTALWQSVDLFNFVIS